MKGVDEKLRVVSGGGDVLLTDIKGQDENFPFFSTDGNPLL